jgi:hypothetical protein
MEFGSLLDKRPARYEIMFSFEGDDVIIPSSNLQEWFDTKNKLVELTGGAVKFEESGSAIQQRYRSPSAYVDDEATATFILTVFYPYVRGILDWQETKWVYMANRSPNEI